MILFREEKIKEEKADKNNIRAILNGMDAQAKQLDIIRTEQVATNSALQWHEKRIMVLEEKQTDYRIRDAEYSNKDCELNNLTSCFFKRYLCKS